ncbi:NAD(P)H-hydrate dehydratase [Aliiroseovarius sp. S1339]|uniref:NAD(P)H-hydrate dehydratase n=1 Tax=Aliiroseovarius sp. S1339 TaxID=2936990 RepID=UPI0020BE4D3E|nr:NAD(P)H-hydrate dehydratase [Aliiroseovarius sp. S1339]MCK8462597.1 NAD(P)H-hydrate dehydratase [Aliiroseovarius sp. S1339]
MTELLTAAQMRAIEQAAIESGEVTGLELMERAGRGVVEAIFEEWPELSKTSHKAVVLCGPGNNGGDGFVVARLLKEWGWEVEVFLYGDAEKLPPDARVNYERWGELGEVKPMPKGFWLPQCDLLLDAVFGTGLTRGISEEISYAFSYLHKVHPHFRCVAVDVPSGVCADSGKELNDISGKADLTVTFHKEKLGHRLSDGAALCGNVRVKDIGCAVPVFHSIKDLMTQVNQQEPLTHEQKKRVDANGYSIAGNGSTVRLIDQVKRTEKRSGTHKYTHGHALILSGPSGKGGAARLAARGALRIGAGLVTVAPTPGALQENAARLDAIMLSPVGDAQTLQAVLADERLNALCLGPGLGLERARELVPVALAAKRATALDADALTAYADSPAELFGMLHENCVLTPHAGEFARLFPDIAEKLNALATKGPAYSKVDATREAAVRAGCVVLFKGPDTVIAAPDGRCSINSAAYERSAPWLATAGSGDVLAGFITGLLARGFNPMQAAESAAWLHVECALSFGPGLIVEDLPEVLPDVFRKLGV